MNCVYLRGYLEHIATFESKRNGAIIWKATLITMGERGKSYHRLTCFDAGKRKGLGDLQNGDFLQITGRLTYGQYVNKSGAITNTTDIIVDVVTFVPKDAGADLTSSINTVELKGKVSGIKCFDTKDMTTIWKCTLTTQNYKGSDSHKITCFDVINKPGIMSIKEGDTLELVGHLSYGKYEDSNGTTRYTTDIIVDNVRSASTDLFADIPTTKEQPPQPQFDDEIPF